MIRNVSFIKQLLLQSPTQLLVDGKALACTIGKAGIATDKHEGDHKTPSGNFPLRWCYYRPDRVALPKTALPLIALTPEDGWCDDPADPMYNKPVQLPLKARHEILWRDDHCYDLIVPLGYNDGPIVPGKGSAIFLHVMHDDGRATEGCIALKQADLLALLPRLSAATILTVP